jgi:hypothetical protein
MWRCSTISSVAPAGSPRSCSRTRITPISRDPDAAARGVEALISVPKRMEAAGENGAHDEPVAAWRHRMTTEAAKRTIKARASLCELSNAHLLCHHGVTHVLVRGIERVTCVALLGAIAANVLAHAARILA